MDNNRVYVLSGSNLGDRKESLMKASELIQKTIGHMLHCSSLYESEPWGFAHQNSFYNMVCFIETRLDPFQLMYGMQDIENQIGRVRKVNEYEARIIDLDILFYNDLVLDSEELMIPHPKLHLRRFTLEPMNEIAPELIHPVFNKSISQLLFECSDKHKVNKI